MRHCEDCKIILESDARFCPKCGRKVDETATEKTLDQQQVSALLASANLYRARQEWDAALTEARRALELNPNDPQVALLLGLIYEQQGNFDEAVVWYRMAMQLSPDDTTIRARLERVTKYIATSKVAGLTKRQLAIVLSSSLLLVILTALITLSVARPKERAARETSYPTSTTKRIQIKTPTTQGTPSTTGTNLATPATGTYTGQSAPVPQAFRTAGELAIRSKLIEIQTLNGIGAVINDVIADPRSGTVVVTFHLPHTPARGLTKQQVLETAWQIARTAFSSNLEVQSVTTRCIITPGGPETTQIGFVGDISRATWQALGDNPTQNQLRSAFVSQWWNPQIA
ncbi:MAG: tetratricopeptide repeat protein [Armatimonadota bacterium]